jgi:hypothetical protein
VAVDVIAEMIEALVQGVPDVQDSMLTFAARMTAVVQQADELKNIVPGTPRSAGTGEEK